MNLRLLKKCLLVCLGSLLVSVAPALGQGNITGSVTSADQQTPIAGVQVSITGTSSVTISDASGNWSIAAKPSDELEFRYLGYKTQLQSVGNRSVIDVVMSADTYQLDDVVVMGYSSTRKAELTSAVVTLEGSKLTDVSTPDVGNMLLGKVAGLMVYNESGQPGTSAKMRIRGIGSLNAESTPLYVVDGIPGGSYNPNDIETLTVLKDVGATAIYGASGANGVIVITTKKATANQPVRIEFKANGGVKEALFGHFSTMNSEEAFNYHKSIFSERLFAMQKPDWLLEEDFDWIDAGFNLGNVQNYHVAVSGDAGKTDFRVSADHYREKGTMINTRYNRSSARLNLNSELFRNVNMSVRLDYSESGNNSGSNYTTLEGLYRGMPWDNPYDAEGNPVLITGGIRPDRQAAGEGRPTLNNKWWGDTTTNPLHDEEYNYAKGSDQSLMADVMVNWDILPWLSVSSTNRFSRSMWNSSTFLDPATKSGASASNGSLTHSEGFSKSFSTSNLIKMGETFGDHTVNGLLGWEWGEGKYNELGLTGMDAFSSSIPAAVSGSPTGDPSWGWSAFAQAQYNFRNKYFVTAVFRADNSSVFAPDKRTGYFPAVSGAWIISNENFLRQSRAVTFLKLRASYGQAGNDKIGSWRYLDAFDFSNSYLDMVGAIPDRLSNNYLHWEVATTFDVGLDVTFGDFLELNLDYYNRRNSDLLMDRAQAPSTGFFSRLENIGEMNNTGFEVQLSSNNWRTKNFSWTTSFNFSYNTNKMTKLIPNADSPEGTFVRRMGTTSPGQIIQNGTNIFTWYMPEWVGVDTETGGPLWYDAEGNTTDDFTKAADRMVGTALPKLYGGLSNSISWKWITLDFNITYSYGNKIFHSSRLYMDTDGQNTTYNQMSIDNGLGWKRWEQPGDKATHPKLVLNGNKLAHSLSSRYLEDGSYIRLRNVTLVFNLPQKWVSAMKMSSARIWLSGDNLFTLSKYSGADPEVNLELTSWSLPGISSMNYPVGRTYTAGIDFTF